MTHAREAGLELAIACGRRGKTKVRLEGELDIASLPRLRRVLFALLEDCAGVVLDLCRLRFVDVPGVRLLVEFAATAAGRECPLEVAGASGQVARLLALTRAEARLPLTA